MQFKLAATKESPVENPAFVIKNWNKTNIDKLEIKINGKEISGQKSVRKGIETDSNGQAMLVIWLKYSSEEIVTIDINIP